jgi:putative Ca2+/H+ antiporter (TMEM165/GDT1 family)
MIAVFPVIFIGELPDKTMFASLILATKGRPGIVWLGAASAFVIHVAIAVTVGVALFHILPHRAVDAIVSAMFFVGAVLAIHEAREESEIEKHEEELVTSELRTHRQTLIASFVVIFLAEWGDLTQILTANLAARYHSPFSVGIGAILALWSVAAIAVFGGKSLMRWLNPTIVRVATAVVLVVLTIITAVIAAR